MRHEQRQATTAATHLESLLALVAPATCGAGSARVRSFATSKSDAHGSDLKFYLRASREASSLAVHSRAPLGEFPNTICRYSSEAAPCLRQARASCAAVPPPSFRLAALYLVF